MQVDVKTAKLIVQKHYEVARDMKGNHSFELQFVIGAGPLVCKTKEDAAKFFDSLHGFLSAEFPDDAGIMCKLDLKYLDPRQGELQKEISDKITASLQFEQSLQEAKAKEAEANAQAISKKLVTP